MQCRHMTLSTLPYAYWSRLNPLISSAMGLHFPGDRWPDLQRGLAGAAKEFGFEDVSACADWLLSAPLRKTQMQVLACHLTVGETYFFRDKPTLTALTEKILPALISQRRGGNQRLRIWSAACCSGEEAYTLAILLHELLPDLSDWQVSILGTDINPRFLQKAAEGVYGEWSFRDAPADLKARYFTRVANGRYAVNPEIKALVRFSHLNLVEDVYPSPLTDTLAIDLICCRNVLMYFSPPQIEKVIGKLRQTLVDDGWLAVSPSEVSHAMLNNFTAVNFPGAILHRKRGDATGLENSHKPSSPADILDQVFFTNQTTQRWSSPVLQDADNDKVKAEETQSALLQKTQSSNISGMTASAAVKAINTTTAKTTATEKSLPVSFAVAEALYQQGLYAKTEEALADTTRLFTPNAATFSLLVRALANQGKLAEAFVCCERWVSADKMDFLAHYLSAVVLLEQGHLLKARACLRQVLYLQPEFALGHFSLGNIARSASRHTEANKHFTNALSALRSHPPDDILPGSDDLSADQLTEIITAMVESKITK